MKMTTITFERSGGVIGNELRLDLDLESLADYEAEHLQKLMDEADFFNIPSDLAANSTPDEFQYVITVEDEDSSHTVRTSDTTMPRALLPLVKELTMLRAIH
jgi:hypothetical protein